MEATVAFEAVWVSALHCCVEAVVVFVVVVVAEWMLRLLL